MASAGPDGADMTVPSAMSFADFGTFDESKTKPFGSPANGYMVSSDNQLPPDMLAAMYTPQPDVGTPITPGGDQLASERELSQLCDFFVPGLSAQLVAGAQLAVDGNMPAQPPRSRNRVLSDKGKQLLSELDYLQAFAPMDIDEPAMGEKASLPSRPRVLSDKGKDLLLSGFDDDTFLSMETARMTMDTRDKARLSPFLNDQKNDSAAFLEPSQMTKQPLQIWSSGRDQCNTSAHVKRTRSASANNGLLVPAKQLTRTDDPDDDAAADKSVRKVAKHWSEEEDARLLHAVDKYGSKNWRKIADFVATRTAEQSAQRWRKALCPEMKHVVKGKWFPHEDERLRELVTKYGIKGQWKIISRALGGTRSTKQCRERWHHHLDPALKVGNWTETEDTILLERHAEVGNSWAQIASALNGRTNDRVKRRFFHLMRKKRRNARVKKLPKPKA